MSKEFRTKKKEFISKIQYEGILEEREEGYVFWNHEKGSGIADYLSRMRSKNASVKIKLDRDFKSYLVSLLNFRYTEKIEIEWIAEEPSELIKMIEKFGFKEKDY